jgi:hypothetical protein
MDQSLPGLLGSKKTRWRLPKQAATIHLRGQKMKRPNLMLQHLQTQEPLVLRVKLLKIANLGSATKSLLPASIVLLRVHPPNLVKQALNAMLRATVCTPEVTAQPVKAKPIAEEALVTKVHARKLVIQKTLALPVFFAHKTMFAPLEAQHLRTHLQRMIHVHTDVVIAWLTQPNPFLGVLQPSHLLCFLCENADHSHPSSNCTFNAQSKISTCWHTCMCWMRKNSNHHSFSSTSGVSHTQHDRSRFCTKSRLKTSGAIKIL